MAPSMAYALSFGSVDCVGELRLGDVQAGSCRPLPTLGWPPGPASRPSATHHELVLERGAEALIQRTQNYWRTWVANETRVPAASTTCRKRCRTSTAAVS